MFCHLLRQTACVSTSVSVFPPPPRLEAGGLVGGGRKSDQMTENKADEEIKPVARDGAETEREERMMEILGQEEEEKRQRRRRSGGDGGWRDALSGSAHS